MINSSINESHTIFEYLYLHVGKYNIIYKCMRRKIYHIFYRYAVRTKEKYFTVRMWYCTIVYIMCMLMI